MIAFNPKATVQSSPRASRIRQRSL